MTDLSFIFTGLDTDLGLLLDDINTDEGLETAVSISLFTDRRASNDDVLLYDFLADGTDDKRGCWIDSYPEVGNDLIGSRLWLLFREKSEQAVVNRAKEYIAQALQWMLDDGVAKSVTSDVRFINRETLQIKVFITRPSFGNSLGDDVNSRLTLAWEINWLQQALKT